MEHSSDTFRLLDDGEIRVNGRSLLDIVRSAELNHVLAERELRIANGTPPDEANKFESDYLFLRPTLSFRRNLLDAPWQTAANGFVIEKEDPAREMATLLGCTCGIIECWFLLASIKTTESKVMWSNFRQFHKDWKYNLGFEFDYDQYVSELRLAEADESDLG